MRHLDVFSQLSQPHPHHLSQILLHTCGQSLVYLNYQPWLGLDCISKSARKNTSFSPEPLHKDSRENAQHKSSIKLIAKQLGVIGVHQQPSATRVDRKTHVQSKSVLQLNKHYFDKHQPIVR